MDTKKLRQKILDLAIRGKLVPQDPNEEPASVLLERIRAEKERLIAEGKIKRPKKSKASSDASHYQNFEPPFELPDSWAWVRLENVAEIVTGNTPSKDNPNFFGGNIPFYKPSDLEAGANVVSSMDSLTDEGFHVSRKLPAQSILVTCIGATIGKVGLIQKEGSCNQQINAILPYYEIQPKYLFYLCNSSYFQTQIKERASATTLPILNKQNFASIEIPLPPKREQELIAIKIEKFFDDIDAIDLSANTLKSTIDSTKSKILELAMQGKLVPQNPADEPAADMLRRINPKAEIITDNPHSENLPEGWCVSKVRDISIFLSRGKSPKYSEKPNQYPVYAQKCSLKEGGISLNQARFLDESTLSKWPTKYRLISGDVLINSTGTGTVGRTRLFSEDCLGQYPFVVPDSHVSVVRSYDDLNSNWLFYYLFSKEIQAYFEDNLAGSTNQKELYIDVIGETLLRLPPINEQKRIVTKIEELFGILDTIKASLQS